MMPDNRTLTVNSTKVSHPVEGDPAMSDYCILSKNHVHALKCAARALWVMSGSAWITFDGQDIIVHSGDQIALTSNSDPVIISALGDHPLIYATR
jgi:hypothetical protein